MNTRVFLLFVAGIMTTFISQAQTKKEIRQQIQANEIKRSLELIESGQFDFVGDRAYPSSGGDYDLTNRDNKLEIRDENARGNLAFYGIAQGNTVFNPEGGGINFDNVMINKKLKFKEKKNQINMSFTVKGANDQHSCFLTITPGGSAMLSIISINRSSIKYRGWIASIPDE
ncbi:DUF4251 domain-containing protein [Bacteroidota bacterium]